jgi:hypothetical protein
LYALSVENESEDTDVGEEMLDASSLEIRDELVPCVIVKVQGRSVLELVVVISKPAWMIVGVLGREKTR